MDGRIAGQKGSAEIELASMRLRLIVASRVFTNKTRAPLKSAHRID